MSLARELVRVPNLLSALRIPLGVAFPLTIGTPPRAVAVLGAAALTDVLDGFYARRMRQESPVGAIIDGLADKVFAVSVLATLVATRHLTPRFALMLASREIVELPLAVHVLARGDDDVARAGRVANRLGKLATTLEFGTLVAVLLEARTSRWWVSATSAVGAVAATSYWVRELLNRRRRRQAG